MAEKSMPRPRPLRPPLDNAKKWGDILNTVRVPQMAKLIDNIKRRTITFIKAGK